MERVNIRLLSDIGRVWPALEGGGGNIQTAQTPYLTLDPFPNLLILNSWPLESYLEQWH